MAFRFCLSYDVRRDTLVGSPMNGVDDHDYLSAGEVARMLHVSPKTISRWAAQGLIPCLVTLGGHRRFRREDVNEVRRRMSGEDER